MENNPFNNPRPSPFAWLRYLKALLSPVKPPRHIEIETTSYCNRKCVYCPNFTVGRPEKTMDEAVFKKIIDSLAKMDFSGRFSPHFYGEPLSDKRIFGLLKYVREKLPRATVALYTNGDFLDMPTFLKIKEAGVDLIRISLHSPQMPSAAAEVLEYAKTKRPDLVRFEVVNFHQMYHARQGDMLNNRGGLIPIKKRRYPYCYLASGLTVDVDGNVVLCCNDYRSTVTFGNAAERDILDIWRDPRYVKARRLVGSGFWVYGICKECNL